MRFFLVTRVHLIDLALSHARFTKETLPECKGASWDHNVITPGTPFMQRLGFAIRVFIAHRLSYHPVVATHISQAIV